MLIFHKDFVSWGWTTTSSPSKPWQQRPSRFRMRVMDITRKIHFNMKPSNHRRPLKRHKTSESFFAFDRWMETKTGDEIRKYLKRNIRMNAWYSSTFRLSVPGSNSDEQITDNFNKTKKVSFDHVFDEFSAQDEVFEYSGVKKLVDSAISGYSATIMAYGQTSSGKTYTIS